MCLGLCVTQSRSVKTCSGSVKLVSSAIAHKIRSDLSWGQGATWPRRSHSPAAAARSPGGVRWGGRSEVVVIIRVETLNGAYRTQLLSITLHQASTPLQSHLPSRPRNRQPRATPPQIIQSALTSRAFSTMAAWSSWPSNRAAASWMSASCFSICARSLPIDSAAFVSCAWCETHRLVCVGAMTITRGGGQASAQQSRRQAAVIISCPVTPSAPREKHRARSTAARRRRPARTPFCSAASRRALSSLSLRWITSSTSVTPRSTAWRLECAGLMGRQRMGLGGRGWWGLWDRWGEFGEWRWEAWVWRSILPSDQAATRPAAGAQGWMQKSLTWPAAPPCARSPLAAAWTRSRRAASPPAAPCRPWWAARAPPRRPPTPARSPRRAAATGWRRRRAGRWRRAKRWWWCRATRGGRRRVQPQHVPLGRGGPPLLQRAAAVHGPQSECFWCTASFRVVLEAMSVAWGRGGGSENASEMVLEDLLRKWQWNNVEWIANWLDMQLSTVSDAIGIGFDRLRRFCRLPLACLQYRSALCSALALFLLPSPGLPTLLVAFWGSNSIRALWSCRGHIWIRSAHKLLVGSARWSLLWLHCQICGGQLPLNRTHTTSGCTPHWQVASWQIALMQSSLTATQSLDTTPEAAQGRRASGLLGPDTKNTHPDRRFERRRWPGPFDVTQVHSEHAQQLGWCLTQASWYKSQQAQMHIRVRGQSYGNTFDRPENHRRTPWRLKGVAFAQTWYTSVQNHLTWADMALRSIRALHGHPGVPLRSQLSREQCRDLPQLHVGLWA